MMLAPGRGTCHSRAQGEDPGEHHGRAHRVEGDAQPKEMLAAAQARPLLDLGSVVNRNLHELRLSPPPPPPPPGPQKLPGKRQRRPSRQGRWVATATRGGAPRRRRDESSKLGHRPPAQREKKKKASPQSRAHAQSAPRRSVPRRCTPSPRLHRAAFARGFLRVLQSPVRVPRGTCARRGFTSRARCPRCGRRIYILSFEPRLPERGRRNLKESKGQGLLSVTSIFSARKAGRCQVLPLSEVKAFPGLGEGPVDRYPNSDLSYLPPSDWAITCLPREQT